MQQDRERAAAQGVARRMASGMGNPAKSVWGCSRQLKAPRTVPPSPARSRIFRLAQNHVVLARSRARGAVVSSSGMLLLGNSAARSAPVFTLW